MKRVVMMAILSLMLVIGSAISQEDITIVAASSEAARGLDLHAVAELFKDCNNLEEFERKLNDPDLGINNLDLDQDGYVDFIRVVEDVNKYSHLIILQAALGDNEFQDVATIEVEKDDDEVYRMHVWGNEVIYGPNFYYVPKYVQFHTWPIIVWIYRPAYRPYRSVWYYRYYPHWYRPYRPVHFHIYRERMVKYIANPVFEVRKTPALTVTRRVEYHPRNSVLVKKETTVIRKSGDETDVRRTSRAGNGTRVESRKTKEVKRSSPSEEKEIHKKSDSQSIKKSNGREDTVVKKSKSTSKKSENGEKSSVKKAKKMDERKSEKSSSTTSKRRDLER